jgi:hypothetical protein
MVAPIEPAEVWVELEIAPADSFARRSHSQFSRPEPVDDRMIEPDPHLSVRADGPRRAVRQRRPDRLEGFDGD